MTSHGRQEQVAGTSWDPRQYLRFRDHRIRPAIELLARVPLGSPTVVCDLGCGAGEVTRLIAERWPSATVYGIDTSEEMLAQASAEPGGIRWVNADLRVWSPPEPADLIYSNAALHWVEDHESLLPRFLGCLNTGGHLAVQMPLSWGAPSHRLMRDTLATGGPGGGALGTEALRRAVGREWVAAPGAYYDLLASRTKGIDIWTTEYLQILEGDGPVLEWMKGAGLRPVLNALEDEEREIFLQAYDRRLREAYPAMSDGRTLYPFRRLFIVASV